MSSTKLEVIGLSGGYGEVIIIKDITLTLPAGSVLCVTGRNGVGKSTLVRLISGALPLAAGTVSINAQNISNLAANQRRQAGLSYAPQEGVVFDTLSVIENLTLHHKGSSLDRYQDLFCYFPKMQQRLEQKAGTLSGGEKKILSFCRTLAEINNITILDEPTEGVQPENIAHMAEVINLAKANGQSFLVVEQNLSFVEQIADQVMLLDHGKIIFSEDFTTNTRGKLQKLMMV